MVSRPNLFYEHMIIIFIFLKEHMINFIITVIYINRDEQKV